MEVIKKVIYELLMMNDHPVVVIAKKGGHSWFLAVANSHSGLTWAPGEECFSKTHSWLSALKLGFW